MGATTRITPEPLHLDHSAHSLAVRQREPIGSAMALFQQLVHGPPVNADGARRLDKLVCFGLDSVFVLGLECAVEADGRGVWVVRGF